MVARPPGSGTELAGRIRSRGSAFCVHFPSPYLKEVSYEISVKSVGAHFSPQGKMNFAAEERLVAVQACRWSQNEAVQSGVWPPIIGFAQTSVTVLSAPPTRAFEMRTFFPKHELSVSHNCTEQICSQSSMKSHLYTSVDSLPEAVHYLSKPYGLDDNLCVVASAMGEVVVHVV
jgi:hypothetical protein